MRIRMRHTVTGTFHGVDGGIERGQVVEVDDENAARYIKNGLAEPAEDEPPAEEHAVVSTQVETAVVKPRRGRPRKAAPQWHDDDAPGFKAVDNT